MMGTLLALGGQRACGAFESEVPVEQSGFPKYRLTITSPRKNVFVEHQDEQVHTVRVWYRKQKSWKPRLILERKISGMAMSYSSRREGQWWGTMLKEYPTDRAWVYVFRQDARKRFALVDEKTTVWKPVNGRYDLIPGMPVTDVRID